MYGDITDPAQLGADRLRDAARRFDVPGRSRMTKPELIEALDYTAWDIRAEVSHTIVRQHFPERGQPADTCGLCWRTEHDHCSPVPGRMGMPAEWSEPLIGGPPVDG